jgi:hypothetical protein
MKLMDEIILAPRAWPSSVEPETHNAMTTVTINVGNAGGSRLSPGRGRWVVSPPHRPARRLPAASLLLPVTPQNRSRLRALRQAEMKAWNAPPPAALAGNSPRHAPALEQERRDRRAFGFVALLAVATVAVSLWKSASVVEIWAGLLHLLRYMVG